MNYRSPVPGAYVSGNQFQEVTRQISAVRETLTVAQKVNADRRELIEQIQKLNAQLLPLEEEMAVIDRTLKQEIETLQKLRHSYQYGDKGNE